MHIHNLDYVGNENGNPDPSVPTFDTNHEGHPGWRIDQLDTNIERWLDLIGPPDVILLHIGTNDFGQNYQTSTAIDRLDNLMSKLCTLVPYGHQVVTNLLERTGTPNAVIQSVFNPFVQDKVNGQVSSGCRVTYLDMRSYVPISDMPGRPLVGFVFCVHDMLFSNLMFPPLYLLHSRWPSSK